MYCIRVKFAKGILAVISFFFLTGCSSSELDNKNGSLKLSRTGGIVINDSIDQAERFWIDSQIIDDLNIIYGREPGRIYKLSLESGSLEFISSVGRGPKEMLHPMQLTIKNENEFFSYDGRQDNIAHFVDDELVDKIPGYINKNVWTRSQHGFFWNNHIITGINDFREVRAMNLDAAKPLAFLNVEDGTLTKHGIMSPTIVQMGPDEQYPHIIMSEKLKTVHYVFEYDYSIMAYDITKDSAFVASSYKPQKMRVQTEKERHGLDITMHNGFGIIEDQLIVVWFNMSKEAFSSDDPKFLDTFGVIYDLPHLDNPREFDLPGRFLGTWNNKILVEEHDDPLEYTIGYYEFE